MRRHCRVDAAERGHVRAGRQQGGRVITGIAECSSAARSKTCPVQDQKQPPAAIRNLRAQRRRSPRNLCLHFVCSTPLSDADMTVRQLPVDAACQTASQGGKATTVQLVDVPGHPRVRQDFERYVAGARGIVFVVDALDFLPHKTETAECALCFAVVCFRLEGPSKKSVVFGSTS